MASDGRRSRGRTALGDLACLLPALVILIGGRPRTPPACSVDASGNLSLGGPTNSICMVPTDDLVKLAVLAALIGFAVLVWRVARRVRGGRAVAARG
ncbi:MAG: hypothetical protein Q8K58_15655 [Acidimicrobiales bacterium]|nr:hypothetical protein [Acidimicrobiales bacterium]